MQLLKAPERIVIYDTKPFKFIVFGCGGTGSYFVRDLARIVGIYNKQYGREDSILICDGDTVESSNLSRQNFVQSDLGKNKAEVLAVRYGGSFGVNIGFIPKYLDEEIKATIISDRDLTNKFPVFIGCVDNNKTRYLIKEAHKAIRNRTSILLDSGNEEHAGQVVFSCNYAYTSNGVRLNFREDPYSSNPYIKTAIELFDLKPDDRHPNDLSCTERAIHAPQNIATNMMAASVLFNYCNTILLSVSDLRRSGGNTGSLSFSEECRKTRSISAHVTFFNSRTGTISTRNFDEYVSSYIEKQRVNNEEYIKRQRRELGLNEETGEEIAQEIVL